MGLVLVLVLVLMAIFVSMRQRIEYRERFYSQVLGVKALGYFDKNLSGGVN
jgi:hypothetical protein